VSKLARIRLTKASLDAEGIDLFDKGTPQFACQECLTAWKVPRGAENRLPNGFADCPRCSDVTHRVVITYVEPHFRKWSRPNYESE
jgi:hypothetical protein